ncbi:uncharacterized protein LOC135470523 isoform X1 [Liolophura sinensis]|uniref:uncharacterized protein LOC135470523 isoform X1 n=1 Tax=Liolophura sinensis TaxID=3198878 RepID=UPI003157F6A7
MTDAEEYRYGVHLAKCSNSSCACMHIQERLHDGIKTLGVTTVVGDSVYSKAGSRSDEILKYAGQSLFTVIPACRDATVSFQYCFTKAPKSLTGRFVVVMSEPIKIPPFLKDFNCIPLYNVKETNEYTSLITWFDNNVTPSLRVTRRPPVRVVPKPVPDRPSQIVSEYRRPEPLPGEHSVHLSVENESSTYTSDSLSTLGTEGRNKFVSLPSLEILEHPDSGPTARQYCTDIDDCLRTEFKNDLQEGRFHLVFNHCDSAAKKRDGVLYALQTFNKRTLPFPLSYAAQLLRCNQENLRLHGLSYIEYKLLRWDAYLKSGEFEDLMTLEGELFEVLADPGPIGQFNIPQVSHIAGLYMLCLAVIRDHFDRDKTDQHKRFKNFLKERQFQIDEENDRNYYYKALQIILREAFEKGNKGSVASILQFKTTLRDFQRDHTHASLQDLKKVTERTLRQTSMYKFRNREARKMERMLTYQVIVRAVVASLKDKCGTASESAYDSHEIELQSNSDLLELLQFFSTQGIKATSVVWQEQFKQELCPLLFHDSAKIVKCIRQIVQYPVMSPKEREHLLLGHFLELFSTVGLEWRGAYSGELSKAEKCQRWKHYIGKIGGSRKPAGALVSIIFNGYSPSDDCSEMYNYGLDGDRKRRTECEILGHLGESSLILQLYAVNSSSGKFLYVMEMPPGGPLQKFLLERRSQKNWLLLQELIDIAVQVICAIEYCHRKQIIHRDIRTENFHYCKADRTLKLDNFGIASHFHGPDVTDVNADEIATLWSSPETLRDKRTSTSSDIWMLGQTLYELFMHGSWPYSPRLMTFPYEKVIYWIAYKGIKPFESSGCIPPEICRAILTCLEMEEAERPTATSLLSHFGDMQSEYHNNEVQIPHVNMEQLPYPRLCKFQVDRASKAIKGIPPELSFPDSPDGIEEHFEPDHWETDFIEDDDPEFSNLTVKTVTHESPLYQHTTEEVKTLSGPISGLIRLTAHTRQQEETVMESEWSCPNPVFLSQYVTRAIDRDDSFIDEVIQIFRDVTKTLTELHKNRCIHRDICAKHILVDPQSGQACVYRIARVKQIKRKHGVKVEGFKENWSTHEKFFKRVRWFPVEVLQDAYYSFKGDVYMLAITIWETFNIINRVRQRRSLTLPFSTISKDKLSGHLAKGAILPSPGTCCPNWLYDVMKECWSTSPAARPTMAHVNLCLERREYIPSFEFKRRTDLNKNRKASCFPQGGSMWFDGEDTVPKRPYTVDFTLCREPWVNDPSNRFTNVPRQMCNRVAKTLANIPPVDSIPQANKGDHMYEQLIPYDPTVQLEAESDAAVYDDIPSYHGSSNAMLHYE